MSCEEINIIIIHILMVFILIYSVIMTIYNCYIKSKKMIILWMIISIIMIIVISFNHTYLFFNLLSVNKIADISLIVTFPILLTIFTMLNNERIALLFFAMTISMLIIFGSSFIVHLLN